jgi:RsiW-degrading membrane proteinase PrsW (M82 family)
VEIAIHRRPRWGVLAASNLPPLAGWLLLAAGGGFGLTEVQALGGFLLAFLLQWAWDSRSNSLPAWYPRLRTLLTLGAVLALAVAIEASLRL